MKLRSMIWKELWQRPTPMLTSLLAVTLGVTAMVAIQNITVFSEQKIAGDMESLGANVLVLPPAVTLQDYYSADMHGHTMPEEYVSRLALARSTSSALVSRSRDLPRRVDRSARGSPSSRQIELSG